MIFAGALLAAVAYTGLLLAWSFRDRGRVHAETAYQVGDVVVYGPEPMALVDELRRHGVEPVYVSELFKSKTGW